MYIDFNQYYNLGILKDFERNGAVAAAAAFGFGAPNDFLSPIKTTTTLKPYNSSDTNNISKNPSSNYSFNSILCFIFAVFVNLINRINFASI